MAHRPANLGKPQSQCAQSIHGALLPGLRHVGRLHIVRRPRHDPAVEVLGAPDLDIRSLVAEMRSLAPAWMRGCRVRPCWFEPTFHKHVGKLCAGIQVHVEDAAYYDHAAFKPWRLFALAFKALRRLRPDYDIWRDFPYEYETGRLAIDVINGSDLLRRWVDDPAAMPADLDALAEPDEAAWVRERAAVLLY